MFGQENHGLGEFFVDGVEPSDVPQFFPLFAARSLIAAMIALFRGGDDEVMVRLMVLREIVMAAPIRALPSKSPCYNLLMANTLTRQSWQP